MGALIVRGDAQLRRIESAIAGIEEKPPAVQRKMTCLLTALQSEREEILRHSSRAPRLSQRRAAADSRPLAA